MNEKLAAKIHAELIFNEVKLKSAANTPRNLSPMFNNNNSSFLSKNELSPYSISEICTPNYSPISNMNLRNFFDDKNKFEDN
jgi:hypothetical protein